MDDTLMRPATPAPAGSEGTEMEPAPAVAHTPEGGTASSPFSDNLQLPTPSTLLGPSGSALGLSGLTTEPSVEGENDGKPRSTCRPLIERLGSMPLRMDDESLLVSPMSLSYSNPTTPYSTSFPPHRDDETSSTTGRELNYGDDNDDNPCGPRSSAPTARRGSKRPWNEVQGEEMGGRPSWMMRRSDSGYAKIRVPLSSSNGWVPTSAVWTVAEDQLLEKYAHDFQAKCPKSGQLSQGEFVRSIHKRFPDRSFEQVFQRLFGPPDLRKGRQVAPERRQEEVGGSSVLETRMRPDLDRASAGSDRKIERRASTSSRSSYGSRPMDRSPMRTSSNGSSRFHHEPLPPIGPRQSVRPLNEPNPAQFCHSRLEYVDGELVDLTNLHIINISQYIDEHDLRLTFEKFGRLKSNSKIYRNDHLGINRGSAFVAFSTVREARIAKDAVHGAKIRGTRVSVNYHRPHPDRVPDFLLPPIRLRSRSPPRRPRYPLSPPPSTRSRSTLEPGEMMDVDVDVDDEPQPDEVSTVWMRQTNSGLLDRLVKHLREMEEVDDRVDLMKELEESTQSRRKDFLLTLSPLKQADNTDWTEIEIKLEEEEVDLSLLRSPTQSPSTPA